MEMLNTSHRYSPVKQSENAEVRSEIGGGGRQWQLVTIVGKLTILSTLEIWSGFDAQRGVKQGSGALYRRLKVVCGQRRG
jgi:hypothetical protein